MFKVNNENIRTTSMTSSCVFIKACVRYFHQIFIFSPNDSPPQTMKIEYLENEKNFLDEINHLKSSFRSRDIQFFVFLSFPIFLPVGHCLEDYQR